MNSNQNGQNQPNGSQTILNADFSMTNIQEVKEDIARDTAPVVPPSYQDALQPGFAGTKASKVREEIQQDLMKAQAKRLQ
ncbi:hypothetical protein [Ammoniphilus sp. 3BR4]|uniref:hypothetical protein n=1 Tax=Ammoniphilus sp. 3BR4 TaxID=3158265 RepID=UPI00346701C8